MALEAASRLFELSGTRAAASGNNLDRHWRNARVHTLHDPVRWKYQLLGNWVLNGVRRSATTELGWRRCWNFLPKSTGATSRRPLSIP
nr:acyl-CoA dehydrogenase [Raoultella sp. NCTC 9187]